MKNISYAFKLLLLFLVYILEYSSVCLYEYFNNFDCLYVYFGVYLRVYYRWVSLYIIQWRFQRYSYIPINLYKKQLQT